MTRRIWLLSLILTLCVWAGFSWPLARHLHRGIPASAHPAPAEVQPLVPGDHIQFMYYCWLAGDMLAGKTPLFCNPYEFNLGGGQRNYRPDSYYFPFSLVYAAGAFAGGRALGWNLTGFLTLWMTCLLTWVLARRYSRSEIASGCAALISIVLPFRWINLCGGSPAGFAMVWIPAMFLGIDLAARDRRFSGGMTAGIALLMASWTDSHIFFFGTLASPGWALVALATGACEGSVRRGAWQRIAVSLLPVPVFLGAALAFPAAMELLAGTPAENQFLSSATGARKWPEVALYSPSSAGFLGWAMSDVSGHIYIGVALSAFLAAGAVALASLAIRRSPVAWGMWPAFLLLAAGIAVVMALALGTNGPHHALFLRACRKIIPPYEMVRQPAKVFCLMPTMLSVMGGIGLGAVLAHLRSPLSRAAVAAVFCTAIVFDFAPRVRSTISILDTRQGAYAAIAADARASGREPHALVVPLWPGDSHYSSAYQYYASLYRIKMVNGYNPFVSKTYVDKVYRRFESVNQGCLDGGQLDELLARGIAYVILHEDLFPEKVSPFPVGWTLGQFLAHERLSLLHQDGRVWAFKILLPASGAARPGHEAPAAVYGCARHWQAEKCRRHRAEVGRESAPFRSAYASMREAGSQVIVPSLNVSPAPRLRWLIRARGCGALVAETTSGAQAVIRELIDVDDENWAWIGAPIELHDRYAPLELKIELASGEVDCDQILLVNGPWTPPAPGGTVELAASDMFHAGYTLADRGAVVLEKGRDPDALVFYGPKLPLEKGRYRAELVFESGTPQGVLLGQFNIKRWSADPALNWIPVVSGARSLAEFIQPQNLPMHLEFRFLKNADLTIQSIRLTRLE